MKKQARFIILQAASIDRTAAKIFFITCFTVNATLLISLVLLIAAPFFNDVLLPEQVATALCHMAFRAAAMGVVTGFTADIVLRRSRK